MVLEDEAPQEEDINGTPIHKDNKVVSINATMSSTMVSPKPIPIPAPVRVSVLDNKQSKPMKLKIIPTN